MAEEVQAPAQVDVLVEHEETLIEATDGTEHSGLHEHRGPGAEQHVLGQVVVRGVDMLGLASLFRNATHSPLLTSAPTTVVIDSTKAPWAGCAAREVIGTAEDRGIRQACYVTDRTSDRNSS